MKRLGLLPYHNLARLAFRVLRQTPKWKDWNYSMWIHRNTEPDPNTHESVLWFHAASVGESEQLIPVLRSFIDSSTCPEMKIVFTFFSPSGRMNLEKIKRIAGERLKYVGPSPVEGEWFDLFSKFHVKAFVTAQYEAWPDLWRELGERKIPSFVVSFRERRSWKVLFSIVNALQWQFPKSVFFLDQKSAHSPRFHAPQEIEWEVTGNPRWDQVFDRLSQKNDRVQKWIEKAGSRPWGILGSVHQEDLRLWEKVKVSKGTLFIVPHDLTDEILMRAQALRVGCPVVVVNEMGVLADLYPYMDWAYVGGGFGRGIHSTIEPAVAGIPVASGYVGEGRFSEIEFLKSQFQWTRLSNPMELQNWVNRVHSEDRVHREEWRRSNETQRGAAKRIRDRVSGMLC